MSICWSERIWNSLTVSPILPSSVMLPSSLAGSSRSPRLTELVPLVPELIVVNAPAGVLATSMVLPPLVRALTLRLVIVAPE